MKRRDTIFLCFLLGGLLSAYGEMNKYEEANLRQDVERMNREVQQLKTKESIRQHEAYREHRRATMPNLARPENSEEAYWNNLEAKRLSDIAESRRDNTSKYLGGKPSNSGLYAPPPNRPPASRKEILQMQVEDARAEAIEKDRLDRERRERVYAEELARQAATSRAPPEVEQAKWLLNEYWKRENATPGWNKTLTGAMLFRVLAADAIVIDNAAKQSTVEDQKYVEARKLVIEFWRRAYADPNWIDTLSEPVLTKANAAIDLVRNGGNELVEPEPAAPDPAAQRLLNKMGKIVIPAIEFRQANIHDVVDFLIKAGIAEDTTTTNPSEKGVGIILDLSGTIGAPDITFTARYISLLQAAKIITKVAGLKYHVEDNTFTITN